MTPHTTREEMSILRAEIDRRLRGGASLPEVDTEIIEDAALDEDHKAALSVYAWSFDAPPYRGDLPGLERPPGVTPA